MLAWLETRLPPPVLLVLLGLAVWAAASLGWGMSMNRLAAQAAGALSMASGLMLNVTPKRGFRGAGTTVNPMWSQASSRLVTEGVYRYTRNPMYLGHVLLLAGWSVWCQSGAGLPAVALQVLWLTRLQIQPEARAACAFRPGRRCVLRIGETLAVGG